MKATTLCSLKKWNILGQSCQDVVDFRERFNMDLYGMQPDGDWISRSCTNINKSCMKVEKKQIP